MSADQTLTNAVTGVGIGLRRGLLGPLSGLTTADVQFMEVAPENWIGVGGRWGKQFRRYAEQFPITLHGLSLNIGGPEPLDLDLLHDIRAFIDEFNCPFYSEHLTYCGDQGHLYDLMPIPFTTEAVTYVAERISVVQDVLGQSIAMENASYYAAPSQELSEIDFINAVVNESGCDLLLDVNNIYVNSINHGYNAEQFLSQLPGDKASYIHIAGHYEEAPDLRVDTHGTSVTEDVWHLLDKAYERFGLLPTLLERDFNFPPVEELMLEIDRIKTAQARYLSKAGKQNVG